MMQQAWADSDGLWQVKWRNSEQRFDELKTQQQKVQEFFELLVNVAYHYEGEEDDVTNIPFDADRQYTPSNVMPLNYVSHQWLDLNSDGVDELLIENDISGRGFRHLQVVFQHTEHYQLQTFSLQRGNRFSGEPFQDLDGDGYIELVIEESVGPYWGWRSPAFQLVIYGLLHHRYVVQSDRHRIYYINNLLPRLESERQRLKSRIVDDKASCDRSMLECEKDLAAVELSSVLNSWVVTERIEKRAIVMAKSWASSGDSDLKALSLPVFERSNDQSVLSYLRQLANDSVPHIAAPARAIYDSKVKSLGRHQ